MWNILFVFIVKFVVIHTTAMLFLQVSCSRMSIAHACVFGLSSSQKDVINVSPKVIHYKDMGILRLLTDFPRITGFS